MSTTLHLVVVPDYGERLRQLPIEEDAWVADTPGNHAAIQGIWAERSRPGRTGGITSFKVALGASAEDWVLDVLGTIEMHHGEHSEPQQSLALRVIGIPLSARAQQAFEDYGFIRFEESADGFTAYKSVKPV